MAFLELSQKQILSIIQEEIEESTNENFINSLVKFLAKEIGN
jgi:hypothetical protein